MRNIYLLRHCETERSERKRCIGRTEVRLSENGIRQAQRLRRYFSEKNLSGIFSSDAIRSAETAEIISGGIIPIQKLAGLREIDMGDWDGMCFDEIKAKFPNEYRQRGLDFASFSPPHGESFTDCQKRAEMIFRDISAKSHGDIAIVAHAGFNRALICSLCCIDLQKLFTISQPFGCVNFLSVEDGVCIVRKTGFEVTEGNDSDRIGAIK